MHEPASSRSPVSVMSMFCCVFIFVFSTFGERDVSRACIAAIIYIYMFGMPAFVEPDLNLLCVGVYFVISIFLRSG